MLYASPEIFCNDSLNSFSCSSWPETGLFNNCDSLSKMTKLTGLETNNEEQRQL